MFSIIFGITYYKMQPVIIRYAESVAETVMLNSANDAVISILENENFSYNDIAVLSENKDGEIISLEIDTYKVNYLKSHISNEISNIIGGRERYDVAIPVGTFLGNTYTAGLGPDIKLKMQITTTAYVDFLQEFRSAGINQVLHKIIVNALLGTPGNAASGEVVRRHLNSHLVTGQDADEVHTQLAGDMSQDDVAVTNIHTEGGIGERLDNDSLQFDHIVFSQVCYPP